MGRHPRAWERKIDTPTLDKLKSQGVTLNHFYVSPLGAPTRSSRLTGRHHLRVNVLSTTSGLEVLHGDEVTLAEAFKAAGYATGCFGKWHNGGNHLSTARGQGSDEFLGFSGGFTSNYFDAEPEHDEKPVTTKGFTDVALQFIGRNQSKPFFCSVPFNACHSPMQAPDALFDKYTARSFAPMEATIHAMFENMDGNIPRLLAKIDGTDTIVFFASDNGPNNKRFNGGMRGTKGTVFEGGTRVPCFIRWMGQLPPGLVVEEVAQHIDVLPTLRDLAGVPAISTRPLDGRNLAPLLRGENSAWIARNIFDVHGQVGRDGAPIARFPGTVRSETHRWVNDGKRAMLFDIASDPGEQHDFAAEQPVLAAQLAASYEAWFSQATSGKFQRFPITLGQGTDLEAPSGTLHGDAHYFGKDWDNDWVTGFKTVNDAITWQIDVPEAGRYEVSAVYCCTKESLGATMRVRVGKAIIEKVLDVAHDPAPTLRPDRVPRWEVPDKKFAVFKLGTLEVSAGPAEVAARAIRTLGADAFELQAIRLKRP